MKVAKSRPSSKPDATDPTPPRSPAEERFAADVEVRTLANLREWVEENQRRITRETKAFRSRLRWYLILFVFVTAPLVYYLLHLAGTMRDTIDHADAVLAIHDEGVARYMAQTEMLVDSVTKLNKFASKPASGFVSDEGPESTLDLKNGRAKNGSILVVPVELPKDFPDTATEVVVFCKIRTGAIPSPNTDGYLGVTVTDADSHDVTMKLYFRLYPQEAFSSSSNYFRFPYSKGSRVSATFTPSNLPPIQDTIGTVQVVGYAGGLADAPRADTGAK